MDNFEERRGETYFFFFLLSFISIYVYFRLFDNYFLIIDDIDALRQFSSTALIHAHTTDAVDAFRSIRRIFLYDMNASCKEKPAGFDSAEGLFSSSQQRYAFTPCVLAV